MQHLSSWATTDRRILVDLGAPVVEVFQRHVQQIASDSEGGGILLGSVRGHHLEVLHATAPTKWDKRFQYLFERLPFGHKDQAELRWTESGGTVRYLGEWHTHPQDYPTPSQLDRAEWLKLAERRQDKRAVLVVIVGRKALHVELVPRVGPGLLLVSIE